ncbi:MAG: amino acid ABC transporter permease [Oscillospiraceae bacterium]|nr:amino acid ABC transporter permease [Oscillospiraceae bacterium]
MDYMNLLAVLMRGTLTTLALFGLIIVASIPGGLLLSLAARSRVKPLVWLVNAFIFVMRGTPLMLQLMFVYFGVPFLPIIGPYIAIQDRFMAAVVAFSLNYAAYFAEIFRGGFLAVDKGQYEAAKVLGLNRVQTMIRVVFPQMIRVALPSVSNESMVLIKDTALVNVVGVIDLLETTQGQVDANASVVPYLFAAVIYLVLNTVLTFLFRFLEKKFSFESAQN